MPLANLKYIYPDKHIFKVVNLNKSIKNLMGVGKVGKVAYHKLI